MRLAESLARMQVPLIWPLRRNDVQEGVHFCQTESWGATAITSMSVKQTFLDKVADNNILQCWPRFVPLCVRTSSH